MDSADVPSAAGAPASAPSGGSARCTSCGHSDGDYESIDLARLDALARERLELALDGAAGAGSPSEGARAALDALLGAGDLHGVVHLLHALGRSSAASSAPGLVGAAGSVAVVSVSLGGVPKRSVAAADVVGNGLVGDRQAARRHHGHPFQAVSLWSLERIEALAADGHPIAPGSCGENLTLTGLDWASMRPGVVLDVGTATIELTGTATPCTKNAQWFSDRDYRRIDHDRHPGWSRWYAAVLAEGRVAAGDRAVVRWPE